MDTRKAGEITQLLDALRAGDCEAESRLAALVYDDLRRIARTRMRGERPDHTLQPTALANEAYIQLVGQKEKAWLNRAHFLAVAAQLMRRLLIDHARAANAAKRGHGQARAPLDFDLEAPIHDVTELLSVDAALSQLALLDARQAKVVELRFFGGLTEDEVAEVLGIASRTVTRDWNMARAFLRNKLTSRTSV